MKISRAGAKKNIKKKYRYGITTAHSYRPHEVATPRSNG